jgi:hypothetical protein
MAFSAIIKPSDYFTPELYVGTGSSRTISTLNFQPDWVWIKNRDTTDRHSLFDVVRAAPNMLSTNNNDAQSAQASELTAFNTNGFTVNTATSVNGSSANYVSWNWKANGAGSSNTDGSITSTVSVNTTSGFSISTYTGNGTSGATIGHGLGVAPAVVLVKRLNATSDWVMYHKGMGASQFIVLNTDAAPASSAGIFYNTAPTSDIFYVGSDGATNASGGTYVAYCFADVQGFSKSSSYIGDGNSRFIYTGFKPAFVLGKQLAGGSDWWLFDSARNPSNIANKLVYPNANSADATNPVLDLLSNGFKMKTSAAQFNGNGTTYLYMAFAEEPLVSTNGVPATAR